MQLVFKVVIKDVDVLKESCFYSCAVILLPFELILTKCEELEGSNKGG